MPSRLAEVIVRCEDLQQRVFIYRLLVEKGVHPRTIQIKHCPAGDATRYVVDQYSGNVRAFRKAHSSKAVVSVMDADEHTVDDRKQEHGDALKAAGLQPRAEGERIAILIPRRNVETWVHHLLGETVNEEDHCRRFRGEERKCVPAAREFARRCPGLMRETDLPSLQDGCAELRRVVK